ncbi:hypothetical protein EIN_284050 [Entamoeba invadens IP1]|uniref:Cysteine protease n=1 Tax=Entamoeba invadens IP1 TaxID=370355 RepID=L7FKM9_ENTIV|nr:hypothetical protein EIN_284050 [Entamoeba invadens IP1]ELP84849.1 hypothetical protein EIN_284050 [Entamoeba invadens IP1]|eukprot:XP_004184195.1 hypothetical protein EIN_284050 [Entamoeba invadens IP1]
MTEDQLLYEESLQNIPFSQWLRQKRTNLMSRFYNFIPDTLDNPTLYPKEFIAACGQVFFPQEVEIKTSSFLDVALTHTKAFDEIINLFYFVYRNNFQPLPNTTLTSDSGWGCTIRSTQMLVANAIGKLFTNDFDTGEVTDKMVIKFFLDFFSVECPFSIHNLFLTKAILQGNINGNSFLPPSAVAAAFVEINKKLANPKFGMEILTTTFTFRVYTQPTIVLIPISIPDSFNDKIAVIFSFYLFSGMVGGSGRKAFYFFGIHHDQLLFLDPHTVRNTVINSCSFDPQEYHPIIGDVKALSYSLLDRSAVLAFVVTSQRELDDLKGFVQNMLGIDDKVLRVKNEDVDGFEVINF